MSDIPAQGMAQQIGLPLEASHDPGGTRLPLPAGVTASAAYGGTQDCYRYLLEWLWDASLPTLMAGMMNPSCAGHECGDRTVAKIYRYAKARGFGRLLVVNADAYRAADQARLAEVPDPCGPDNLRHILQAAEQASQIVIGHGAPKVKAVRDHGPRMVRALRAAGHRLHAWRIGKDGSPWHPLYVADAVDAVPWEHQP